MASSLHWHDQLLQELVWLSGHLANCVTKSLGNLSNMVKNEKAYGKNPTSVSSSARYVVVVVEDFFLVVVVVILILQFQADAAA